MKKMVMQKKTDYIYLSEYSITLLNSFEKMNSSGNHKFLPERFMKKSLLSQLNNGLVIQSNFHSKKNSIKVEDDYFKKVPEK